MNLTFQPHIVAFTDNGNRLLEYRDFKTIDLAHQHMKATSLTHPLTTYLIYELQDRYANVNQPKFIPLCIYFGGVEFQPIQKVVQE